MIVYLNGEYLPAEEARISPLDRGFLFGDGIYEVTTSYDGKPVALKLHLDRMNRGLNKIGIESPLSDEEWAEVADTLCKKHGGPNLGIYFHVSRGNEWRRFHGFPVDLKATVFAVVAEVGAHPVLADRNSTTGLKTASAEDMRWQHCNVKSTSLLGNVLHFQEGYATGKDETILYNRDGELTEASISNVFVVKDGVVATPLLDNQKLPGITRHIVVNSLRAEGSITVEERVVTMEEVRNADEVWVTNSSKHIAPVIELDDKPIGDGKVGAVWEKAKNIYEARKFDY